MSVQSVKNTAPDPRSSGGVDRRSYVEDCLRTIAYWRSLVWKSWIIGWAVSVLVFVWASVYVLNTFDADHIPQNLRFAGILCFIAYLAWGIFSIAWFSYRAGVIRRELARYFESQKGESERSLSRRR